MTEKELRRLSCADLLEMLVEQGREVERLRQGLKEATDQLNQRAIVLQESGSIAEAGLKLNGIFETAQAAADQYLESIQAAKEKNI